MDPGDYPFDGEQIVLYQDEAINDMFTPDSVRNWKRAKNLLPSDTDGAATLANTDVALGGFVVHAPAYDRAHAVLQFDGRIVVGGTVAKPGFLSSADYNNTATEDTVPPVTFSGGTVQDAASAPALSLIHI